MLGFVWRNCKNFKNILAFKLVYVALVRSILEYGSNIWNPSYQCHIDRLEKVQKRFLFFLTIHQKMKNQLKSYTQRLSHFKMHTLESRRWIIDQMLLYKILSGGLDCPELLSKIHFSIPRPGSRIINFQPFSNKLYNTNVGRHSALARICREHNVLFKAEQIDILSCSLLSYKNLMYKYKK